MAHTIRFTVYGCNDQEIREKAEAEIALFVGPDWKRTGTWSFDFASGPEIFAPTGAVNLWHTDVTATRR